MTPPKLYVVFKPVQTLSSKIFLTITPENISPKTSSQAKNKIINQSDVIKTKTGISKISDRRENIIGQNISLKMIIEIKGHIIMEIKKQKLILK